MHPGLLHAFKILVQIAIPLASFATGLRAAFAEGRFLSRHPSLFARALLVILVIVPVGTVIFLRSIAISPLVRAGLTIAIVSIGIGPPAAFGHIKAYAKAAGRDTAGMHDDSISFEVGLNVVLLALAIVYIPAFSAAHGAIFHHAIRPAPAAVAKVVLTRALVPLALGLAVGRLAPRVVAPVARYAGLFVQLVLLLVVLLALVATGRELLSLGGRAWLTCLAIVLGEVAVGHALGGPALATRRVLASFSAMRFPALALLVVQLVPRGRALVPIVLAYVLTSFVVVSIYAVLTSTPRRRGATGRPRRVAPAVGVGATGRYGTS
jgi:predicted Na+-dependent transporter